MICGDSGSLMDRWNSVVKENNNGDSKGKLALKAVVRAFEIPDGMQGKNGHLAPIADKCMLDFEK